MTSPRSQRFWSWGPGVAVLVTWSLTVIGAVWTASSDRAEVRHDLRVQQGAVTDHEARLRALERQASEVAADVRWIRQTLEKQSGGGGGRP